MSVNFFDTSLTLIKQASTAGSTDVSENSSPVSPKKSSKKHKRSLTPHMSARWYRSPELCLNLDTYDTKIDIWAIGCIFHELETTLIENQSNSKAAAHRILFQGTSCYPLSPNLNEDGEIEVTKNDQLVKILKTLGCD